MNALVQRLTRLSSAEEFLDFLAVPYEQSIVNVSRLHILKRFFQYLQQEGGLAGLDDNALYQRYRTLLGRAYNDFVHSTPAKEKVFKVFQDAEGKRVSVEGLRATLPSQR